MLVNLFKVLHICNVHDKAKKYEIAELMIQWPGYAGLDTLVNLLPYFNHARSRRV